LRLLSAFRSTRTPGAVLGAAGAALGAAGGVPAAAGGAASDGRTLLTWRCFGPTANGCVFFSSMSVENETEPSSAISTRGVVPRMPMVATGVSTFMSPVFATLPAMNVKVPLVRLNRDELDFLLGS